MPKVKVAKKSTFVDMTAMSDVTVLLLTFFILTSTFLNPEPIQVTTPASVSEIKIPETNILSILVSQEGKIFLTLDRQDDAYNTLKKVGEDYKIDFTEEELREFAVDATSSFGVPISRMKEYLAIPSEKRSEVLKDFGVPMDSTDNQFRVWVRRATEVNKTLTIAIKADQSTPYPIIKDVMTSLQEERKNRYNLLTSLKAGSSGDASESSGH